MLRFFLSGVSAFCAGVAVFGFIVIIKTDELSPLLVAAVSVNTASMVFLGLLALKERS
jgi:hypothetical protein